MLKHAIKQTHDGRQTVKALMELGGDSKIQKHGQLEPLGTTPGLDFSNTQQLGSIGFGNSFKSTNKDSPTRRFKKPVGEGKIISTLLGAGDDPLGRD